MWKIIFYMAGLLISLLPSKVYGSSVTHVMRDSNPEANIRFPKEGYFYTSYQRSIECLATQGPFYPTTLDEVQAIVLHGIKHNLRVKAVGNLHSITDSICTDGILVDMSRVNHFSFDVRTNYATAGAGLELQDFLEYIHGYDRGLSGTPSFGGITVGGAIGSGAHGTNLKSPATLSDQLVSVTFVDGLGNIRKISEGEEDFKAFRVNLGLLGIIYELVVRTTEQYKLEIKNFPVSDEILWREGEIMRMAEANDFFQFFWFPTNRQVVMSVGNRVNVSAPGNCQIHLEPETPSYQTKQFSEALEHLQKTENQVGIFLIQSFAKLGLFKVVPGRSPFFTKEDGISSCLPMAVGYSHRMLANRCKECSWTQGKYSLLIENSNVLFDISQLSGVLRTLKEITDEILIGFPLIGLIFKFVKESDAYLGLNGGRRTVAVEWVSTPRFDRTHPKLGIAALQAFGQALIEIHGGRPHWGKSGLYYTNPRIIHRAYPDIQKFIDVMKRMDPNDLFMNDLGRRIKYGGSDVTMSVAAKKRCALNEACLCSKDSDCGDGGPSALICSDFNKFKVCKKRASELNELIEATARAVINSAVGLTDNITYIMGELVHYKGF